MKRGITRSILSILQKRKQLPETSLRSQLRSQINFNLFSEIQIQNKISQSLAYLLSKKFVSIKQQGALKKYFLTSKGNLHARNRIPQVSIKKPNSWNGKWYIIAFDIPLALRARAEGFRRSLKELDFYQLQKSLWVYPYPCETELAILAQHFGLKSNMRIIRADRIEGDGVLKKTFGLSG